MTEEAKRLAAGLRNFSVSDTVEYATEIVLNARKGAALIETLSEQLEQVTRERDAAIRDFTEAMKYSENCMFCKYLSGTDDEIDCNKPKIMPCENCWQWRGVEVES